jgi:hypothetical protein
MGKESLREETQNEVVRNQSTSEFNALQPNSLGRGTGYSDSGESRPLVTMAIAFVFASLSG